VARDASSGRGATPGWGARGDGGVTRVVATPRLTVRQTAPPARLAGVPAHRALAVVVVRAVGGQAQPRARLRPCPWPPRRARGHTPARHEARGLRLAGASAGRQPGDHDRLAARRGGAGLATPDDRRAVAPQGRLPVPAWVHQPRTPPVPHVVARAVAPDHPDAPPWGAPGRAGRAPAGVPPPGLPPPATASAEAWGAAAGWPPAQDPARVHTAAALTPVRRIDPAARGP
jgi:hypothetical protein